MVIVRNLYLVSRVGFGFDWIGSEKKNPRDTVMRDVECQIGNDSKSMNRWYR